MALFKVKTIGDITIGYADALDDKDIDDLTEMLHQPVENANTALGGRRKVNIFSLPDGRAIAVKHYARGGLVRFLVKETYLKLSTTRAEAEFMWLENVRRLGLSAPEPLAFAFKGHRLYKCWLITREIENHQTLADIAFSDIVRTNRLIPQLLDQTVTLIQNSILHVDFHAGNVLVNDTDQLFLIDFDKARIYRGSQTRLAKRYISRWQRAVKKYKLPELLEKDFHDGLMGKI